MAVAEASCSDGRADRAELCAHADEALLGGAAGFLGADAADKDAALQQAAAVANLRAALLSKSSLLSVKAEALGDDGALLLEYLPPGAHSLSRKCRARGGRDGRPRDPAGAAAVGSPRVQGLAGVTSGR